MYNAGYKGCQKCSGNKYVSLFSHVFPTLLVSRMVYLVFEMVHLATESFYTGLKKILVLFVETSDGDNKKAMLVIMWKLVIKTI